MRLVPGPCERWPSSPISDELCQFCQFCRLNVPSNKSISVDSVADLNLGGLPALNWQPRYRRDPLKPRAGTHTRTHGSAPVHRRLSLTALALPHIVICLGIPRHDTSSEWNEAGAASTTRQPIRTTNHPSHRLRYFNCGPDPKYCTPYPDYCRRCVFLYGAAAGNERSFPAVRHAGSELD